jgi:cytochrome bd-type quinol oxidase subunit 2
MTVRSAAATDTTLLGFIIIAVVGGVFLIPSLVLLFAVFKGRNPAEAVPRSSTR